MKKYAIIIAILIILSSGTWFAKAQYVDVVQEVVDEHLTIQAGELIRQKFVSAHDNLSKILIIDASNPTMSDQTSLLFKLADESTNTVIRSINFTSKNIGTSGNLVMSFAPVINSKNKSYIFELQSSNTPPPLRDERLIFGYSKVVKTSGGYNLHTNLNLPSKGNLSFRTYYKDRIIYLIRDSMINFISRVWVDRTFSVVYLLTLTVLLFASFHIRKK